MVQELRRQSIICHGGRISRRYSLQRNSCCRVKYNFVNQNYLWRHYICPARIGVRCLSPRCQLMSLCIGHKSKAKKLIPLRSHFESFFPWDFLQFYKWGTTYKLYNLYSERKYAQTKNSTPAWMITNLKEVDSLKLSALLPAGQLLGISSQQYLLHVSP